MQDRYYDVAIIGSGPAGEGAAMKLTKSGFNVCIIEAHDQVGGGCAHWGTIPSKSLRHSIQTLIEYQKNPLFQSTLAKQSINYPAFLKAAERAIQEQVNTRFGHYMNNDVEVIRGRARFADTHRLEILRDDKVVGSVNFKQAIIATGSRPYQPPDVDFTNPHIVDSDGVLRLDATPKRITIYGAGVIGCEYASIFANLGCKVNLVNTRDRLLSFLDDEITDALSYYLRHQGVVIRHNEEYERIEVDNDTVTLYCKSGKLMKGDILLWANGRTGNAGTLGLEALDIEVNHREQVIVDECYRTSQEHIYAVGDVIGPPGLASASYDQGRWVGTLIADKDPTWEMPVDAVPTGIYTSPEISSLGKTEQELTDQNVPYEVAQAMFKDIARAQITNRKVGMLKILFHRETLEILGIHCFGEMAAEIIHIGQAIMSQKGEGNNLKYFAETTFNYPTMAQAYRVAALNGLNRL